MKTILRKMSVLLLMFSMILLPVFAYAESEENEEIVMDYEFTSKSADNLSYDAPKSITQEEKEYTLKDVSYEVINEVKPYEVEREVSVNNLEDFEEQITETVEGKTVVLKAEKPEWEKKELPREHIIREEKRVYASGDDIPSSLIINGERYIETSRVQESSSEPFSTPAYFMATDIENTIYSFNGKIVEIKGDEPHWNGWKADVMDYLNVSPSQYSIDSISWNGDFEGEEGSYKREATVTGSVRVYSLVVTYTYDSERELNEEDIEYLYTAKVSYKEEIESYVEAVCHAVYVPVEIVEEESGISLSQAIGIGAGVAALAGAGAYLFFFLGKKRKKNEE